VSERLERLTRHWYQFPAGASPLLPLSWAYGGAVRLRHLAYQRRWLASYGAGRPLLVVGNLSVGGTGKTPLTLWLAESIKAAGIQAGIASRGHGRQQQGTAPREVTPASPWQEVGDEPLLLAIRSGCPVRVCRDRVAAARALVAAGCEVILADDGLQHLRLKRDCEIVVIDGARGFGNGRLLPAGPLREPPRRLAQADVIVVNGAPDHASLQGALPPGAVTMSLVPGDALPVGADGGGKASTTAGRPLKSFRGAAVHAVAGIGNPRRFFATLTSAGLDIIPHPFPDHHPFSPADIAFADGYAVLMTEKDAVKCRAFARPGLWYVPVSAQLSEADARNLLAQVSRKLGISLQGSNRG
jgi:tetraacyldisaccharide 4'-kinase